MATDPMWVFESYGEAAELIDELEAENAKLRAELERRTVDGWKLVPVEPTPEMAKVSTWDMNSFYSASKVWAAMLAAAPSAPKADDPVKVQLLEALEFAAKSLATMTSADGTGHADIALCILRMAGYDDDERERMVDGWKQGTQWRTDAIAAARKEGGKV